MKPTVLKSLTIRDFFQKPRPNNQNSYLYCNSLSLLVFSTKKHRQKLKRYTLDVGKEFEFVTWFLAVLVYQRHFVKLVLVPLSLCALAIGESTDRSRSRVIDEETVPREG